MAKHDHAFDKGEDEAKLAATSEQYQEQTGQDDLPEAGPDPVIEAQNKAIADRDIEQPDEEATTAIKQEPIVEKSDDSEAGS